MEGLFLLVFCIGIPAALLAAGWFVGHVREQAHLRGLDERENAIRPHVAVFTLKQPAGIAAGAPAPVLLTSEVVIASDYFKTWFSGLKNLFGGEMTLYTRLYMRARREALLRVMEQAREQGCHAICNVRYDSCDISSSAENQKQQMPMAACLVSATAYRTRDS